MIKKMLLALIVFSANLALANSLLQDYLASVKTIKADFTQISYSGAKQNTAKGRLLVLRPNNFKWVYPASGQQIIANGKKIYIYDEDLAQVTIRGFESSLDRSPAFILSGGNNLNKYYKVTKLDLVDDGLVWEQVTPIDSKSNNGFSLMQVGFANKQIKEFKFVDEFNNKVTLKLSNVILNKDISATDFDFKIPQGVDILE